MSQTRVYRKGRWVHQTPLFFQFKNGTIVQQHGAERYMNYRWLAWDRSLGAWVGYV